MKLVGAGFGNDVDDRAAVASVFGRKVERLDLHFLDRVERGIDQGSPAQPLIVIRCAVKPEIVPSWRGPVRDEPEIKVTGDVGAGTLETTGAVVCVTPGCR